MHGMQESLSHLSSQPIPNTLSTPVTVPTSAQIILPMSIGPVDEENSLAMMPHAIEQTTSPLDEHVNERFIQNHALHFMATLPEMSQQFEYTTIITPAGVFQVALENKDNEFRHFKCVCSIEQLTMIHHTILSQELALTTQSTEVAQKFTLKQLNQLEEIILTNQGHTLFGYTISSKLFVIAVDNLAKLCGRASHYPPLPQAASRQLLSFIEKPIIQDIVSSVRVAAQTNVLFDYFLQTYFHYHSNKNDDDQYNQFRMQNLAWRLLALGCVVLIGVTFLQSKHINRSRALSKMLYIRNIEQSVIGCASNLTNYGPDFISTQLIESLFLPILVIGGYLGHIAKNQEVTNIAQLTTIRFLFENLFLALTVGSFCSFGLDAPLNNWFFLYSKDTSSVEARFWRYDSIARYTTFALMMACLIPRYPHFPLRLQHAGYYASNAMNSLSIVFLNNYGLNMFIDLIFESCYNVENFSKSHPVIPALSCTLNALSFFTMLLTVFPTTQNLPMYSIEPNPHEGSFEKKLKTLTSPITDCCAPTSPNPESMESSCCQATLFYHRRSKQSDDKEPVAQHLDTEAHVIDTQVTVNPMNSMDMA